MVWKQPIEKTERKVLVNYFILVKSNFNGRSFSSVISVIDEGR